MTSRRGFLSAVSAAIGAFALDPERALWKPGAKLISVPAVRGFSVHAYRFFDSGHLADVTRSTVSRAHDSFKPWDNSIWGVAYDRVEHDVTLARALDIAGMHLSPPDAEAARSIIRERLNRSGPLVRWAGVEVRHSRYHSRYEISQANQAT